MIAVLIALNIFAAIFLIGVVLLQTGKGADMGAAFGGASSTVFGASGAGNVLTKLTAASAAVFMLTSLALAVTGTRQHSVFDSTAEPAFTAPPAPAAEPEGGAPAAAPEGGAAAAPETGSNDLGPAGQASDMAQQKQPGENSAAAAPQNDTGSSAPANPAGKAPAAAPGATPQAPAAKAPIGATGATPQGATGTPPTNAPAAGH